jgi:hypothetical protein
MLTTILNVYKVELHITKEAKSPEAADLKSILNIKHKKRIKARHSITLTSMLAKGSMPLVLIAAIVAQQAANSVANSAEKKEAWYLNIFIVMYRDAPIKKKALANWIMNMLYLPCLKLSIIMQYYGLAIFLIFSE